MHIYIVFCHPSKQSFTYSVLETFLAGLKETQHSYELGDLYEMNFQSDMVLEQYAREVSYKPELPVPDDVRCEQEKINRADALVFIYPVWWSDCPAKLKGWFDRVWTMGYAYGFENGVHKAQGIKAKNALVVCTAGHPNEYLEQTGIAQSMRTIFLNDRLSGVGIKDTQMEILGGMVSQSPDVRRKNLEKAYFLGKNFLIGRASD